MTHGPDEPNAIELCSAMTTLRQKVDALLRGHHLDIRELTAALAIGNPRHPDKGRIHITYATGDVSIKRVTWEYLGPLHGYEPDDDPDREPGVTAAQIIAILTGHTPPPTGPDPDPGEDSHRPPTARVRLHHHRLTGEEDQMRHTPNTIWE
jgi:hypothetical protein